MTWEARKDLSYTVKMGSYTIAQQCVTIGTYVSKIISILLSILISDCPNSDTS